MASRDDVTLGETAFGIDESADEGAAEELVSPSYTLLKESVASDFNPTHNEIANYAEYIGLDPQKDEKLLYLAREGLTAQLPKEWNAYQNQQGDIFYWNQITGVSSWDHPMDEYFRELVREAKVNPDKVWNKSRVLVSQPCEPTEGTSRAAEFRGRLYEVVSRTDVKVTAGSAIAGSVILGGTGAVAGTTVGAVTGAAVGVVPALFTFGLSIPVCGAIGGGVGCAVGTATGAGAGLVVGGAAGYGGYRVRQYVKAEAIEEKRLAIAKKNNVTTSVAH